MKKRIKKWMALMLSVSCVLSGGTASVWAGTELTAVEDDMLDTFFSMEEEEQADMEAHPEETEESEKDGDILTPDLSEAEVIPAEEQKETEEEQAELENSTEEAALTVQTTPKAVCEQADPATGKFIIRISGVTLKTGESLLVPVWQDAKQKDIIWNTAKAEGADYVVQEKISAHDYLFGTYQIHVYKKGSTGSMTFLTNTSVTIQPTADALEAVKAGTSETITLSGAKLYGAAGSVQLAVWSAVDGQDDLKWYPFAKKADGSWKVTVPLENHKGNGTYYAHAYMYTPKGNPVFIRKAEFTVGTTLSGKVKVSDLNTSTGTFVITVSDIIAPDGIRSVLVPVWSKADQSDIVWYNAEKSGDTYVVKGNLSKHNNNTGSYRIHVYLTDLDGTMKFLTNTTMTVNAVATTPAVSTFSAVVDGGRFEIKASGVTAPFAIQSVRVPVWNKADQSDIVWYTAVKEGDSYVVRSDISEHSYHTGSYQAHLYLTGKDGKLTYGGGKTSFETALSYGGLKAESSDGQKNYVITLSGLQELGEKPKVRFAVWSKENGQDDLKWYDAKTVTAGLRATVAVQNHGSAGLYYVHCYAFWADGSSTYIGKTEFTVAEKKADQVSVSDVNADQGSFSIKAIVGDETGVTAVKTAVWSESDQGDIYWYTMKKQADGSWTAKMDYSNHKKNRGVYHVHTYAFTTTGTRWVGATDVELKPVKVLNRIVTEQLTSSTVRITVYDATVNGKPAVSVQYPTWSQTNGQDDILWYKAEKQSDGSFRATIDLKNHMHEGLFHTHIYGSADGTAKTMIGSVDSTLKKEEEIRAFDEDAKAVMRKIIFAVETGGQVYGNVRYDCFVEAYTNSAAETAISIGAAGWFAGQAKNLLNLIRTEYPADFRKYDTAGIGEDLDNSDWKYYGGDGAGGKTILKGSEKALAIQAIISSPGGIAIQNRLVDEQMIKYADQALALGVTDLKARLFCANLQHLGGYNAMVRVINYCKTDGDPITLENLWSNMREREQGGSNLVGADKYAGRHQKVMQWLNQYL